MRTYRKLKKKWDNSYKNKDNYLFYPHEEIIRFISKYIRKRIGHNEFVDMQEYVNPPKVLDFGCGIGRHVFLADDFSFDVYGFDLSEEAIKEAKKLAQLEQRNHLVERFIVADITNLPYEDKFFDFMFSHGVLDSMPFKVAKDGISELYRTLKDNGIIYFDVIDVEDSSYQNEGYEQVIQTRHEQGTIQCYFSKERIYELLYNKFEIIELYRIKKEDILNNNFLISRYHVIAKKINLGKFNENNDRSNG